MQPVQDLTVEDRVSRTQFQYTLEDADAQELTAVSTKLVDKLHVCHELRDVASDQQSAGLQADMLIDRDTASRLGISAAGDRRHSLRRFRAAAGLDHLYAAQPVSRGARSRPAIPTESRFVETIYVQLVDTESRCRFASFTHLRSGKHAPLAINHQGQFPVVTLSFNLAPGVSLGDATQGDRSSGKAISGCRPAFTPASKERRQPSSNSLATEPWLILAAIVTVYIVLGVLYESYIHPITILSTLPSAGVGAILALLVTGNDLSVVALIGIILLIGIVKKNAIMMIDFALEAEREEHKAPEEAIYQAACCASVPS